MHQTTSCECTVDADGAKIPTTCQLFPTLEVFESYMTSATRGIRDEILYVP